MNQLRTMGNISHDEKLSWIYALCMVVLLSFRSNFIGGKSYAIEYRRGNPSTTSSVAHSLIHHTHYDWSECIIIHRVDWITSTARPTFRNIRWTMSNVTESVILTFSFPEQLCHLRENWNWNFIVEKIGIQSKTSIAMKSEIPTQKYVKELWRKMPWVKVDTGWFIFATKYAWCSYSMMSTLVCKTIETKTSCFVCH